MQQNLGNTIIIKHADNLYSKISHIKKDSFKVAINDFVYKGQMLANNGSSGRSPEPHIHFQLQSTSVLSATTIIYPLSNYVSKIDNKYKYHISGIPNENDVVSNAISCTIIKNAFNFIPGKKLKWKVETANKTSYIKWEVFTDIYNHSYIFCHESKAMAWFVNDGNKFYFTTYEGNKNSLLFMFYKNVYKVAFTYYQDLVIEDSLPIYQVFKPIDRVLNDFILPFKNKLSANYKISYESIDDYTFPKEIKLTSELNLKTLFNSITDFKANIFILDGKIDKVEFINKTETITVTCEN